MRIKPFYVLKNIQAVHKLAMNASFQSAIDLKFVINITFSMSLFQICG